MFFQIVHELEQHNYKILNDGIHLNQIFDKNLIWNLINPIKSILQEIVPMKMTFNLEDHMLVFPKKYLIAYIIGALFNIYHEKRDMQVLYDIRTHFDHDCIFIVNFIKNVLIENESYCLEVILKDNTVIYLPWNDYVVPNIADLVRTKDLKNSKTIDYLDKDKLKFAVQQIRNKDVSFINSLKNEEVKNHFVNNTDAICVAFNGTACAGKTNLLFEVNNYTVKNIDETAKIEKVGKYGNFKGKDNNQILSLSYQLLAHSLTINNITSVLDRDVFNNMIWRFILRFINGMSKYKTEEKLQEAIVNFVHDTVPANIVQVMKRYPIIVIVDLNEKQNRTRMFDRGTGGDRKRCYVKDYVEMQNMFYMLFAYLCCWPVFDTTLNQDERKVIKKLALKKIKANAEIKNKKCTSTLRQNVSFMSTIEETFPAAKKLKIMK